MELGRSHNRFDLGNLHLVAQSGDALSTCALLNDN
jgi:hypothetical protein